MDEAELERLAAHGLSAILPVERLRTVADYCWDHGETSGDARYCSLWRTLDEICEVFEDAGYMRTRTVDRIDQVFRRHLPGVLSASSAEEGALQARRLREEIQAINPDEET